MWEKGNSCTVGGNINEYSHYGEQYGHSLKQQQQKKPRNKTTISSVQFSRSVVSDSLQPHESQHPRTPCPSPSPGVHSGSRPSSQWCHPAISSSVVPFSSCSQSLSASESFPMSLWRSMSRFLCVCIDFSTLNKYLGIWLLDLMISYVHWALWHLLDCLSKQLLDFAFEQQWSELLLLPVPASIRLYQ